MLHCTVYASTGTFEQVALRAPFVLVTGQVIFAAPATAGTRVTVATALLISPRLASAACCTVPCRVIGPALPPAVFTCMVAGLPAAAAMLASSFVTVSVLL